MRRFAIVYRVEREDNTGPYRGKGTTYSTIHDTYAGLNTRHPTPSRDGICDPSCDLFGFHTKRLFQRWFNTRERAKLAGFGFVLSVYRVGPSDIRRGKRQCVFSLPYATLLRREALV